MASASSEKKPKLGFIAIDLYHSGCATKKDTPISIAISTCQEGCKDLSQIDTMSVRLNLNHKNGKSWRKLWVKQGWDLKYFDQYWLNNLDILEEIDDDVDSTLVLNRRELANTFKSMLQSVENRYQKSIILYSDPNSITIADAMLRRYDFHPPLNNNRDRWEQGTFCTDIEAAILGVLGLNTKLYKMDHFLKALDVSITPRLLCKNDNSRVPRSISKNIIVNYLAACKYAKKDRKTKKRQSPTCRADDSPAQLRPILSVGIEAAPADCDDPAEITSSTVNLYIEPPPTWMSEEGGERVASFIRSNWDKCKDDFIRQMGSSVSAFRSAELNSAHEFKARVDAAVRCHISLYGDATVIVDSTRLDLSRVYMHLKMQDFIPWCFKEDGSYVYPKAFHLGGNIRQIVQKHTEPHVDLKLAIQKYKESLYPHMLINTLEPHEYNQNARIILFEYLAIAKISRLKLKE